MNSQTLGHTNRLKIYDFLVTAFYEPDPRLLELLSDHRKWADIVLAVENFCGTENPEMKDLPKVLSGQQKPDSLLLQDLQVEYTRLFLGPAAPPCPPYESVYDPNRPSWQEGTILGPATRAMEELLRAEELVIVLDYAEYADHIAIELELMYYLLTKDIQMANDFLNTRLLPWLPFFGDKLAQEARHPFYRMLGNVLCLMMKTERGNLNGE